MDNYVIKMLPFFLLIALSVNSQTIPFPLVPDWESNANSHRATGLGLADINNDGWKDLVVANGNDMALQKLVVYYNEGDGSFPLDPDWSSGDIDYNGHLAVGDINKDGWLDVAVSVYIGHDGFEDPGKVKVYYNEGGELESTPSFESYNYYTFSCALGDADGDGDLDLATTGGEPYGAIYDGGKIFINRNGTFSEYPEWESSFTFGSLDVDFGDVDLNGYLDVIFSSEDTPNYIFLADDKGTISSNYSWESAETSNYINSLDFGFTGSDKVPGIVMTGNDQLGGNGEIRLYDFEMGVPSSGTASWTSDPFGYGSGILLADINSDDILDLIYGGWWLPVKIALGDDNGFELTTSYTSNTSSVVETIQIADLDKDGIQTNTETFIIDKDSISVIYLEKQLVENILSIKFNNLEISNAFYCYVPNKNWISFNDNLVSGDELVVEYEYSDDGDMVISNWDSGLGNYIFYSSPVSTGKSELNKNNIQNNLRIFPNPATDVISIEFQMGSKSLVDITVSELTGKKILNTNEQSIASGFHNFEIDIANLPEGVYLVDIRTSKFIETRKIIIK